MVEKTARVMTSAILIGIVVTNAIVLLDPIAVRPALRASRTL
jgi:multidrug efflux pump subunit AcrB